VSYYPLPEKVISKFLAGCDEVLILEENEPFLETQIKALAYDLGTQTIISGKQSRHVAREGELYRWQIQQALEKFLAGFAPAKSYLQENEAEEIPNKESYCTEAGYGKVLDALEAAAESIGQKLVLVGDPGCLVTVAERLDAKYAIGSSIGVADGMSKVRHDERPVALFGDSAFFHTSIPAICNVVHNRSDILMVVLDNKSTASTGHQSHPGIGKDAMGHDAPGLSIKIIARACGVEYVHSVDFDDLDSKLINTFRETLSTRKLALVIVQTRPVN
jgi:indolepyruvate ferredoxin oxidoreductase, alpha subunit